MSATVDSTAREAAERRLLVLMQVDPEVLARMTTTEIEQLAAEIEAAQADYAAMGFVDEGAGTDR